MLFFHRCFHILVIGLMIPFLLIYVLSHLLMIREYCHKSYLCNVTHWRHSCCERSFILFSQERAFWVHNLVLLMYFWCYVIGTIANIVQTFDHVALTYVFGYMQGVSFCIGDWVVSLGRNVTKGGLVKPSSNHHSKFIQYILSNMSCRFSYNIFL